MVLPGNRKLLWLLKLTLAPEKTSSPHLTQPDLFHLADAHQLHCSKLLGLFGSCSRSRWPGNMLKHSHQTFNLLQHLLHCKKLISACSAAPEHRHLHHSERHSAGVFEFQPLRMMIVTCRQLTCTLNTDILLHTMSCCRHLIFCVFSSVSVTVTSSLKSTVGASRGAPDCCVQCVDVIVRMQRSSCRSGLFSALCVCVYQNLSVFVFVLGPDARETLCT